MPERQAVEPDMRYECRVIPLSYERKRASDWNYRWELWFKTATTGLAKRVDFGWADYKLSARWKANRAHQRHLKAQAAKRKASTERTSWNPPKRD